MYYARRNAWNGPQDPGSFSVQSRLSRLCARGMPCWPMTWLVVPSNRIFRRLQARCEKQECDMPEIWKFSPTRRRCLRNRCEDRDPDWERSLGSHVEREPESKWWGCQINKFLMPKAYGTRIRRLLVISMKMPCCSGGERWTFELQVAWPEPPEDIMNKHSR